MLSWGVIAYGGALSAILAILFALAARQRALPVLVAIGAGAFAVRSKWWFASLSDVGCRPNGCFRS